MYQVALDFRKNALPFNVENEQLVEHIPQMKKAKIDNFEFPIFFFEIGYVFNLSGALAISFCFRKKEC